MNKITAVLVSAALVLVSSSLLAKESFQLKCPPKDAIRSLKFIDAEKDNHSNWLCVSDVFNFDNHPWVLEFVDLSIKVDDKVEAIKLSQAAYERVNFAAEPFDALGVMCTYQQDESKNLIIATRADR